MRVQRIVAGSRVRDVHRRRCLDLTGDWIPMLHPWQDCACAACPGTATRIAFEARDVVVYRIV